MPGGGATLIQTQPVRGQSGDQRSASAISATLAVVDADPSIGVGGATIGWLNAAMRACCRMAEPDFADAVPMPVLIVLGRRGERRQQPRRRGALRAGVKTAAHLRIPGARHEILMERDEFRDQFWVAFDAFIAGRDAEPCVALARRRGCDKSLAQSAKFRLRFVQSSINCAVRYSYRSPHWAFPP